jgi:oligosaccharide repeat unit polymerase
MLIVLVFLILIYLVVVPKHEKKDIFSVHNVMFLFLFYLFIGSKVAYPEIDIKVTASFQYILLYTTGILGTFLGFRLVDVRMSGESVQNNSLFIKPILFRFTNKTLLFFTVFHLIICILIFYLKISRLGLTLSEYFIQGALMDHIGNYLAEDTLVENALGRITFLFYPFSIIFFERCLKSKHFGVNILIFLTLIILPIILISATRMGILLSILFWIVYRHYYVIRLSILKLLIFGVVFMGLLVFLNSARGGIGETNTGVDKDFVQYTMRKDLSPIFALDLLHESLSNGRKDFEYGKDLYYFFLSFVPRTFWAEKPLTAFEPRMTVELIGEIGHEHGVLTFTNWGVGYSQFGLFGAFIYSVAYGYILILLVRKIRQFFDSRLFEFYCIFLFSVGVRASIQFPLFMFVLYFAVPTLLAFYKGVRNYLIRRRRWKYSVG